MIRVGRTAPRLESWQPGFAVRREWPRFGTHEFFGFHLTEAEAGWVALADRVYWRRGLIRPVHSVVRISVRDFELHLGRRDCRAPDCPTVPPVGVVAVFGTDLLGEGRAR